MFHFFRLMTRVCSNFGGVPELIAEKESYIGSIYNNSSGQMPRWNNLLCAQEYSRNRQGLSVCSKYQDSHSVLNSPVFFNQSAKIAKNDPTATTFRDLSRRSSRWKLGTHTWKGIRDMNVELIFRIRPTSGRHVLPQTQV